MSTAIFTSDYTYFIILNQYNGGVDQRNFIRK